MHRTATRARAGLPPTPPSVTTATLPGPAPAAASALAGEYADERNGQRAAQLALALLWLGYVAFLFYGSLVPLQWRPMPLAQAWSSFHALLLQPPQIYSRTDASVNLLLGVPLSLLGAQAAWGRRRYTLGTPLLWLLCVGISMAVEFSQQFTVDRTPSQTDVLAQAVGALLGLGLQAACGPRLHGWVVGWWRDELGAAFAQRVLHGWLAVLLLFALMPLDIASSAADLLRKWRDGRVHLLPFTDLPHGFVEALYHLGTDVLLWLPVGVLWRLQRRPLWHAVLWGLGAAAALEGVQLFILSRSTSSTDVLAAGLGVALGHGAARRWAQAPLAAPTPQAGLGWAAAAIGAAALAVAAFWYPFNVRLDGAALRQQLAAMAQAPLHNYYASSELRALNELLRKPLMLLPAGLLWSRFAAACRRPRRWLALGALLGLACGALIEAGQLLLPGKVSDPTDAVLEAAGVWLGLAVGGRLWRSGRPAVPMPHATASAMAGAPRSARPAAAPPLRPPARPAREAATVLLLALALDLGARLPGVPYNVRELMPSGLQGVLAALALAALAWALFVLPLHLLARWERTPQRAGHLLWLAPATGLVLAVLVAAGVPRESLDDVVGTPTLGGGVAESALRFAALMVPLLLASAGAAWAVARIALPAAPGLLRVWLIPVLAWALPSHYVIVTAAATDNLTELMHGGGSALASACLYAGVLALWACACALAALPWVPRRGRALGLALLAGPAAAALLWAGSETTLVKYDRVFSAAQFLLSPDREHYAAAPALALRFALGALGLAAAAALLQAGRWRALATSHPQPPLRRRR